MPCLDAHAPSRDSRPREAKYASDSSSVSRSTAPSARTARCIVAQWIVTAARGFASSSRPLREP